ncbi:AAA domain-containing protein [Pseudomonadota bacterium]
MDERKVLILDKGKSASGEPKNITRDVREIKALPTRYEITFNNGQVYNYSKSRVVYFDQPEEVSLENTSVYVRDLPDEEWDSAVIFQKYVCLFKGKNSRFTLRTNVEFISSIPVHNGMSHVVDYYRYIANAIKGDTKHINYYFTQKLNRIRSDSVLNNFANQITPVSHGLGSQPLFPFGINPTQRQAVIHALEGQVSLIQGPPGTGKTQTILNIIANLLVREKTVAIVAGNNSATANVYEKLEKYGLHFIAAKLGNTDLQKQFFASQTPVPDTQHWKFSSEDKRVAEHKVESVSSRIIELLDSKNRLAEIKETLARLVLEEKVYERHFPVPPTNPDKWSFAHQWSTSSLLNFLAEVEFYSEKQDVTWPVKLRWLFKYRIYRFKDLSVIDEETIRGIVREYYRRRTAELEKEVASIENKLSNQNFDVLLKEYTEKSMVLFRDFVAEKYQNLKPIEFSSDTYKQSFDKFLERFPIVISTTDSIINNKSPMGVFDYLIVDEASQVDLLTGTLAMSCAKNIVAVGDLNQLPHIPHVSVTDDVDKKFNVKSGYSYRHNSLLSSLSTVFAEWAPSTLLKEHYRCHPRIIDYCNQKFYNNQLIIMTEADNEPFKVLKTAPGSHQRKPPSGKSLQNEREIDVIVNEVLGEELKQASSVDIGITTPYRGQANRAQEIISGGDVQVDTVYKYQGREKETIIFSTTASKLNRFVDNPNLLNVAVSRAKRRFVLVTTHDSFKQQGSNIGDLIRHIEYQSLDECIFESKTVSIFDCLYKEYSEVLMDFFEKSKKKGISIYSSENLMATLLDELLEDERYNSFAYHAHYAINLLVNDDSKFTPRERQYSRHPNTHVDLLVYNKLDKSSLLAIEVDGYRFHKLNKGQIERDKLKNSIFEKIDLPLLRFGTEGSGEREKLKKALDMLLVEIDESTDEQLSTN